MSLREIRLLGDPVLRERAAEVEAFDDDLRVLVRDMFETMAFEDGAGLAAPQVGVPLRVLVADVRGEEGPRARVALVNPHVVERSDDEERGPEGCLSIPGVTDIVPRAGTITVEGRDPEGREVRIEAEGLYARVLQHEVDHLDGILFIDHLTPLKRRMLLKRYRRLQEEEV